jgi:D-galacturonate reductase
MRLRGSQSAEHLPALDVIVQSGEINIDQAHRGYNMASDGVGYRSVNPLFMKYTPSDGFFSGQRGYGELGMASWVIV